MQGGTTCRNWRSDGRQVLQQLMYINLTLQYI
jgi:hypothetical protein